MTNNEIETKYSIKYLGELPIAGQIYYSINVSHENFNDYYVEIKKYLNIEEIRSMSNFKIGSNIICVYEDPNTEIRIGYFTQKEIALRVLNQYLIDVNQIKNNIEKL